jgi:hypothetical protein
MAHNKKVKGDKILRPKVRNYYSREDSEKSADKMRPLDDKTIGSLSRLTENEHANLLANARSDEERTNLSLHLQSSYGNAYVQRLLSSRAIQTKLTVSQPDDPYEKEADRVAEEVTQKPIGGVERAAAEEEEEATAQTKVQRQEEEEEETAHSKAQRQEEEEEETAHTKVQRQEEEEEETAHTKAQRQEEEEEETAHSKVQRQEEEEEETAHAKAASIQLQVEQGLEANINSARGGGQPLAESTRNAFEPRFGVDFSDVNVHTDARADQFSRQLKAEAFTTGRDIFFKEGTYQPDSENGQKLIAHELTHVVQQGEAVQQIQKKDGDQKVALPGLKAMSPTVPALTDLTVTRAEMMIKAGKKQEAIDIILGEIKASKMPMVDQLEGKTIKYDKNEPDIGGTYYNYDPDTNKASKIGIAIGEAAFSSVSWLYSTMSHEYQHAVQMFTDPKKWNEKEALSEFVAWGWEIFHAHETGVINNPAKMKELGDGLKSEGWDKMSMLEKLLNSITYYKALKIVQGATAQKK